MKTIYNILIFVLLLGLFYGCERNTPSDITGDNLPPAVPVNVKIYSAYDGEIQIVWHANVEPDLSGYHIYRSIDSTNFVLMGFSDQNYYLDDSLDYSIKYYYYITSLDVENHESEPSKIVSATPENIYPPFAPRFLTINARNWINDIYIYLTWDPGYETDIAGFNIYRSTIENFNPDSSNLIGFTHNITYSDTFALSLLTTYYYKIKAVDKGNLQSNPGSQVSDMILPIPDVIYPVGIVKANTLTFKFIAIPLPTTYKVSLQTNPYFGEFWGKVISSNTINDTISVEFSGSYLDYNVTYYWRVSTYTVDDAHPNSISALYSFTIVPE
ncbi:MAG TPA: hypothetical protein VLB50_00610 [Ignavibacteriaceae bacterium]|nr:hypothetical protein [Ignavibacteriaceae bacterium]